MQGDTVEVKMKGEVKLLRDILDVLSDWFNNEEISSSSNGTEGEVHFILGHGGLS